MGMDRREAENAFLAYAAHYDAEDIRIRAKKDHTMRVAEYAGQIAGSVTDDPDRIDFAWFLGLLHDIGRFEQVRCYGTFYDSDSVDHAELGADLLFREGLIDSFPCGGLFPGWQRIAEDAVRSHNKLKLPEEMNEVTRLFSEILRDADKTDIFRVIAEIPYEQRAGTSRGRLRGETAVSPAVMDCVHRHECIPRPLIHTRLESRISHCSLAFELVFAESRRITLKQGYLKRLLEEGSEQEKYYLGIVKEELERAFHCEI